MGNEKVRWVEKREWVDGTGERGGRRWRPRWEGRFPGGENAAVIVKTAPEEWTLQVWQGRSTRYQWPYKTATLAREVGEACLFLLDAISP